MTSSVAPSPTVHPALQPASEVPQEMTLEVSGTIPPELRGTLYRNGPGRWEGGGFVAQHAFDGDGMIAKFVIDDGAVRFQSRYVQTPKYTREQAGKGASVRGMGNQRRGGPLANVARFPADPANIQAVVHADRLLALSDPGRPWSIDLDDLTTRGECNFDGKLPRLSRFSPHPRIDPISGELFNFGLDFAPRLAAKLPIGLRCYRVDRAGRLHTEAVVALDHAYVQHDFAITEHYLVFILAPIILDPIQAALGLAPMEISASYRSDVGTKIVLVPRRGGKQRHIECPPLMYMHINNAFEDGDDVVVDIVRHDDYKTVADSGRDFRAPSEIGGFASRVRVTKNDRVTIEDFSEQRTEMPQHDQRRTAHRYRYGYFTTLNSLHGASNRIVKVDADTGRHWEHVFEPGDVACEPIFVPRSANAAEDDGWLLTVVYLVAEHRSALVILDARDPSRAPIATARLDGHHFPGFHGSFTERIAVPARPVGIR